MKAKKMILSSFITLGLMFGGVAYAADLDGAIIERIGVNPDVSGYTTSSNIVFVSHSSFPAGTALQCVLHKDMGDAGLATALTAMSLGKSVWLRVGSTDVTKITTATIMYLNK
ncbi:MAG: hypothetical protein JKY62_07350 [Desulfocapsa sp.]|uniref:Uncharacterized protein n=1 Tax=Desulfotalea psychrophila TaxID=84980 RepID=A0ABS3AUR1_9BACT|nr:hypothetical protein [Desulfocapsa sp.]MBN4068479.1 hypothetical protein [Desulfotalea psychrophila]